MTFLASHTQLNGMLAVSVKVQHYVNNDLILSFKSLHPTFCA